MPTTPHIAALHVYPFKSARGVSVESAEVDEAGLRWDRRWMLVTPDGDFISQRTRPRLAHLRVALEEEGIRVSAPGLPELALPFDAPAPHPETHPRPIRVWKNDRYMVDCGDEAARWASDFLGEPCRVARALPPPEGPRVKDDGRLRDGFADGAPALVVSEASLADLNARLPEPISMNRFRPNVVVAGVPAYGEDTWRRVRMGEVAVRGGWPCPRCVLTTVDQDTAEKGPEPLRTLATYRRNDEGEVDFGMNVLFEGEGVLRVGDLIDADGPPGRHPARRV